MGRVGVGGKRWKDEGVFGGGGEWRNGGGSHPVDRV